MLGTKNALTYGGNLRYNRFHLSIAPGETQRTEGGGYIQDEFVANDHFRFVAGGRVDKFQFHRGRRCSRRAWLSCSSPTAAQSIRVSYNRAYRAPSMVNNDLDTTIGTALPLSQINPGYGNADLLRSHDGGRAIRN